MVLKPWMSNESRMDTVVVPQETQPQGCLQCARHPIGDVTIALLPRNPWKAESGPTNLMSSAHCEVDGNGDPVFLFMGSNDSQEMPVLISVIINSWSDKVHNINN